MSDIKMCEVFAGDVYSSDDFNNGTSLTDDHGCVLLSGERWAVLAAKKAINTHDTMQARIVELEVMIKEADAYLDINSMTSIGGGSILHTKFKQALKDIS